MAARAAWLQDDRAALALQRTYRGHLGRRRVFLMHEMSRVEAETREAWVEVRDDESGDVWYFNQVRHRDNLQAGPQTFVFQHHHCI